MTDSVEYPTINGYGYSWASLKFKFPKGVAQPGVKDISFKLTIDRGKVRGAGRRVLRMTQGNLDYSGTMTMLTDEYLAMITTMGDGYMDFVFPITIRYEEGVRIHTVVMTGVRLGEEDFTHSQGTDGLETKIKLDYLYYDIDGIRHVKSKFNP